MPMPTLRVSVPAQLWCIKLFDYYRELNLVPLMKKHFRSGKNADFRETGKWLSLMAL